MSKQQNYFTIYPLWFLIIILCGCKTNNKLNSIINPNRENFTESNSCVNGIEQDLSLTIEFNYGPPLKYIKTNVLNHEVYDSKLDSLLEYIRIYKDGKMDSDYYVWYSNRDEINNINFSVLNYVQDLYYHNDTLFTGNVFYSNYNIKEMYCCDTCTPLDDLIKKDFIVKNGKKQN